MGAGGLGSPVALYLASAGVGTLTLCDGDTVDLTNLQRQIVHRSDALGMAKAASAQRTLAADQSRNRGARRERTRQRRSGSTSSCATPTS